MIIYNFYMILENYCILNFNVKNCDKFKKESMEAINN